MEVMDGFIDVKYVKNNSYVDDNGIYVPFHEYTQEGVASAYHCLLTKELFVEAYNKWIVETQNGKTNQRLL